MANSQIYLKMSKVLAIHPSDHLTWQPTLSSTMLSGHVVTSSAILEHDQSIHQSINCFLDWKACLIAHARRILMLTWAFICCFFCYSWPEPEGSSRWLQSETCSCQWSSWDQLSSLLCSRCCWCVFNLCKAIYSEYFLIICHWPWMVIMFLSHVCQNKCATILFIAIIIPLFIL